MKLKTNNKNTAAKLRCVKMMKNLENERKANNDNKGWTNDILVSISIGI